MGWISFVDVMKLFCGQMWCYSSLDVMWPGLGCDEAPSGCGVAQLCRCPLLVHMCIELSIKVILRCLCNLAQLWMLCSFAVCLIFAQLWMWCSLAVCIMLAQLWMWCSLAVYVIFAQLWMRCSLDVCVILAQLWMWCSLAVCVILAQLWLWCSLAVCVV